MKSEQTFSMTKGSIAKTAFECATKYFGVQSSIHKNEYIFVPLTKYGILKNARLFLKHRLRWNADAMFEIRICSEIKNWNRNYGFVTLFICL